jgi:hypothetical protein
MCQTMTRNDLFYTSSQVYNPLSSLLCSGPKTHTFIRNRRKGVNESLPSGFLVLQRKTVSGGFGESELHLNTQILLIMFGVSMTAGELLEMTEALGVPDPFISQHRHHFIAIEALCLLCARLRSAADQLDLSMRTRSHSPNAYY